MRDRQSLAVLRAHEGTIVLERMYFADEVRPAEEHAPEGIEIDDRELDLADQLIAGLLGPFRPERYEDTYRERLFEIIEARRAGEGGLPPPPPEPEAAPGDLMAQLKASLASAGDGGRAGSAGGGGRKASNGGRRRGDGDGDGTAELRDLSRDELYERAREADIPGRSDMTKDRLIEALSAAE
jgi:DNA end-binding protein Ku